jgi:L-serine dehydratase
VRFENVRLRGSPHPNTARLTVQGGGRQAQVVGSSIGAGRIVITEIDQFPVELTGSYPALVLVADDQPGAVARVATALTAAGVNVATLRVSRRRKGGDAIHVYELDSPPAGDLAASLQAFPAVKLVRLVPRVA